MKIRNLTFAGAGKAAITYIGAVQQLAERDILKTVINVAGASSGSLMASLLATNCKPSEMENILSEDFARFLDQDAWFTTNAYLLNKNLGLHPGNQLDKWLEDYFEKKLGKKEATFKDLKDKVRQNSAITDPADYTYRYLYVVATNLSTGKPEIFSHEHTENMPIAKAISISMRYPLLFYPKNHNNYTYVDGGLGYNFPIDLFDSFFLESETLGLRTCSSEEYGEIFTGNQRKYWPVNSIGEFIYGMKNVVQNMQEKNHQKDFFRTIFINIGNCQAVHSNNLNAKDLSILNPQFSLSVTADEKKFLIDTGKKYANDFFDKKKDFDCVAIFVKPFGTSQSPKGNKNWRQVCLRRPASVPRPHGSLFAFRHAPTTT